VMVRGVRDKRALASAIAVSLFPRHHRLGSHVPYKSLVEAGCRLGSLRTSPKLIPEEGSAPGFDIV
jgi:hypothetical protein